MSVTMRFGHLTDYATTDAGGKLIIAGIFDIAYAASVDAEVVGIIFTLVARLECSIADGLEHDIRIQFVDGEEELVGVEMPAGVITFSPTGPGRPFAANVVAKFAGLPIRGADDYRFVLLVDGQAVGAVPLYVQLAPGVSDGA
jgi:hypothetical protein